MRSIHCTECQKAITQRNDLAIAGKLMQPYHVHCLDSPTTLVGKMHKFTGRFPTGIGFWILVIAGNSFLTFILKDNQDSLVPLIVFAVIFNVVFIGARIAIYFSYEQHLL